MRAIDRIPSILERCAKELVKVCDDAGGCDHKVGICCCDLYALIDECDKARKELAAEEKSGDEGLREDKKEMGVWCPTCYGAIKSSERRPNGDSICVNGHKHKTGEFLVGYAPSHPTPKEAPVGLVEEVVSELQRATVKFGPFNSAHEGYAVLKEEVDELWDEIKKKSPDKAKLEEEAKQIAAMGLRFAMDICGRKLADRPTPSRTGELVKRLREFMINRRDNEGYEGHMAEHELNEILRDFEGGA